MGGAQNSSGIVPSREAIAEDLLQLGALDVQVQDRAVAIHHRSDGRIDGELRAHFGGQRADAGVVLEVLAHQHIGEDDLDAALYQQACPASDFLSDPGSLVMASCTSARCE